MSGECDSCGEHAVDCICISENLVLDQLYDLKIALLQQKLHIKSSLIELDKLTELYEHKEELRVLNE